MDFKIGVIVNSFRLGVAEGIKKAAEVGADGVQLHASRGETAPENLTPAKRKELLDMIKSNGMVVSALVGDFGHPGFCDASLNAKRIEDSKRVLDLAKDLETNVVTTHIGAVPDDDKSDRWKIMKEACEELGEYGDKIDASFAIETGPESAVLLKKFLDSMSSNGVRVNFDPANLVMVVGDVAKDAVKVLGDYIVHTHAKDGIMLNKTDREIIYGLAPRPKDMPPAFKEVPLGEGDVNFPEYLEALASTGFKGFLTIEREVGTNPEADIRKAVTFLKDIIGR
ncbi:MAG TPA: xylose isomerase [Clostridiales bacterium]|nr:xylose isomerase [Clostridiales bacterium]